VFVVVVRTEWTTAADVVETDTVVHTALMTAAPLAVAVRFVCALACKFHTASAFAEVRIACAAAPSAYCARHTASPVAADLGTVLDRRR